jgi:hypothetical protein
MRNAETVVATIHACSQCDSVAWNERLESRVHQKVHARFGGGRLEKDVQRTSPAAYPTVTQMHRS